MAKPKRSNRDHARPIHQPAIDNETIAQAIDALVTPAIFTQQAYYRQLGLRDRVLNLSLMLAAVLTLLWRKVPGVQELTRMLARENLLWCQAVEVSQQAVSQRFLSFPSELFERVFRELLPPLQQRWQERLQRPLPLSVQVAQKQFERLWIVDTSTLEALFRKLESLQDKPVGTLAGKMGTMVDLVTRLPVQIWFQADPQASDVHSEGEILQCVPAHTLLMLDRGFYHFQFWAQLIEQQAAFITRLKAGASYSSRTSVDEPTDCERPGDPVGSETQERSPIKVAPS